MLKYALLFSMVTQLAATIYAISLIKRTRYNVSWILISLAFVLMAVRRLFDISALFWETKLFQRDEINAWIAVFISVLMLVGVIFIREIFNLHNQIEKMRDESEQKMLSAVIKAEDMARKNFARELHDGLGPALSSIKMSLTAIKPDPNNQLNQKIIENACRATDDSIMALKEISDNLSPHILRNYGLENAIKDFAERLFTPTDTKVELDLQVDESRLSDEFKTSSYRIVSELMHNSLKHANPTTVKLKMKTEEEQFTIRYEDDGSGLKDPSIPESENKHGMGFNNIVSRTKSLGGTFKLSGEAQKGFSIDFFFMLK